MKLKKKKTFTFVFEKYIFISNKPLLFSLKSTFLFYIPSRILLLRENFKDTKAG